MMELINDGFIDEERFSRSFCRGKFQIKKWGRRKIEFELKMKKISSVCIKKGMEEIEMEEYLRQLENQVEKKNRLLKEKNNFIDVQWVNSTDTVDVMMSRVSKRFT